MYLCFSQYLTDEVDMPLNMQGMSFLFSLDYDCGADHLGGCGDVEQEGLPFIRGHQNGRVGEELLEVLEGFLGLESLNKVLGLPQELV
jgi:hypothetical protein